MSKKSSEKASFNGSGIGKVIAVILIIIIIIFAVLFLLSRHGFGFGKGNNSSDSSAVPAIAQIQEPEISSDNTVSTTTSTTAAENYIEVKIDENNYLYNNTKYSVENIDQLIDELNKNTDSIVKIVENEASLKAYNTLIDRLNENKISYIDYTIGKGETTE